MTYVEAMRQLERAYKIVERTIIDLRKNGVDIRMVTHSMNGSEIMLNRGLKKLAGALNVRIQDASCFGRIDSGNYTVFQKREGEEQVEHMLHVEGGDYE